MIFSTLSFIIFFTVFILFIKFTKFEQKKIIILFSLFFYGFWNPLFILLIIYLSLITFFCSKNRYPLSVSLSLVFFPLIYFKYSYFLGTLFSQTEIPNFVYNFELPLAISFITFTAAAFIVDLKRRTYIEEINFLSFLEFIIYFPQLIAGPILRANELIPSLKKKIVFSSSQIKFGLVLFTVGFIKKVYFADSIGTLIDPIFDNPDNSKPEDLVKGFLLFPLQIYFDFSGYVDMALGISNILSIELPINFNKPYLSKSLTDFWRSWHITLSKWFKDYLYIPLGGSKTNEMRLFFNLITTMTLAGLWHGANFNFIIWGFLNGILLFVEKKFFLNLRINKFFKIILNCFIIFNLWIVFRIQESDILIKYFILLYSNIDTFIIKENLLVFIFTIFAIFSQKYDNYYFIKEKVKSFNLSFIVPIILLIVALGLTFSSGGSEKFIYFDF